MKSFYDLFPRSFPEGPPPKGPFKIDAQKLKAEFIGLQSANHPDKVGSIDPTNQIRKQYETKSSDLNIAYKSLLNPLLRAHNLLIVRGIDALSEKDSFHDEDLLMDVLIAREAMAEAASKEELDSLKKDNDQRINDAENKLEIAFKEDDLETAKAETIKLSYWQNLQTQLKEAAHEIDQDDN